MADGDGIWTPTRGVAWPGMYRTAEDRERLARYLTESSGPLSCEWRARHDRVRDIPVGDACGLDATQIIVWLDGSGRWSPACDLHIELDQEAPPHFITPIPELKSNPKEDA